MGDHVLMLSLQFKDFSSNFFIASTNLVDAIKKFYYYSKQLGTAI